SRTKQGAMIRRQEKLSARDEEQDPHRLVVSRKVILRGAAPSFLAWLATAAARSCPASLTRKSRTRRGTNGALALTHSKGPALLPGLAAPSSIQTLPRVAGQWVIRCNVPRTGTNAPGSKGIISGNRRSFAPIQAACRPANVFASPRLPRAGIVNTTSCVAARTRKVKRRAAAIRRKLIR